MAQRQRWLAHGLHFACSQFQNLESAFQRRPNQRARSDEADALVTRLGKFRSERGRPREKSLSCAD